MFHGEQTNLAFTKTNGKQEQVVKRNRKWVEEGNEVRTNHLKEDSQRISY